MKKDYTVVSNLAFLIKKSYGFNKSLLFATLIRIPINIILPLIAAYLTKHLVEIIENQNDVIYLLIFVASISLVLLGLNLVNTYTSVKIRYESMFTRMKYFGLLSDKNMKTDFQNVDNPEGQKKAQKAQNALNSSNSGTEQLFNQLVNVFSNFFGLLTYSFILFSFNVWIVLILFVLTLANYFVGSMFNKWYHKNKDNWAMLDRKIDYVNKKAGDYNVAKDIRIFNMASCFITLFNKFFSERMSWKKKEENYNLFQDIATIVITFLRDGLAYGLLVYQIVFNDLTVADFILYFAIITQYSNWLLGFAKAINEVRATSFTVDDIREFLDMPDRFNRNTGVALPSETCSIEFKNISFEYPKTVVLNLRTSPLNIRKLKIRFSTTYLSILKRAKKLLL